MAVLSQVDRSQRLSICLKYASADPHERSLIPDPAPHILSTQRMDPVGESIAGRRRYRMPRSTYFVQECPTCGRNLQVRVEYLGKQVVCQHCSARFEACEPGSEAYSHSQL